MDLDDDDNNENNYHDNMSSVADDNDEDSEGAGAPLDKDMELYKACLLHNIMRTNNDYSLQ
jgi:hypothetical protein